MNNLDIQKTDSQESETSGLEEGWMSEMPMVLHALSNKLLPIMAFSDLGSRRCEDPQLREYFDKIRQAAADSREFIIQLRQQFHQRQKDMSDPHRSVPDQKPES